MKKNSKWIKCGLPYGPIYAKNIFDEGKESFSKLGLNKPGTIICMEDGTQYLIGDINKFKGVCDDCTAFEKEDIVKEYMIIDIPK